VKKGKGKEKEKDKGRKGDCANCIFIIANNILVIIR